jgi:pimeloyl-ACP methyl ester carboxylesterase
MQHPDNVDSILFLAPVFPPDGPGNTPPGPAGLLPTKPLSTPAEQYGFPMKITTKAGFRGPWDHRNQSCPGQREDGIVDVVWNAIMENDVIGHHGDLCSPVECVMRVRNAVWWGWNNDVVHTAQSAAVLGTSTVPVLIVYGELVSQANQTSPPSPIELSVPKLYAAIQGTTNKLMFRIACTGHFMPWESQYTILHRISEQLAPAKRRVFGQTKGSYFLTQDGEITAARTVNALRRLGDGRSQAHGDGTILYPNMVVA